MKWRQSAVWATGGSSYNNVLRQRRLSTQQPSQIILVQKSKPNIACFAFSFLMPLSPVIAFAQVEFDPGNVIHHLGVSSFTGLLWSRYYRLILHQLGTSLAARQLAADETNILITLLLGHSSSSQGTHAVSHFRSQQSSLGQWHCGSNGCCYTR